MGRNMPAWGSPGAFEIMVTIALNHDLGRWSPPGPSHNKEHILATKIGEKAFRCEAGKPSRPGARPECSRFKASSTIGSDNGQKKAIPYL